MLDINGSEAPMAKIIKPTIFANENIRIELRNGYDRKFLREIIEVLINDTEIIK